MQENQINKLRNFEKMIKPLIIEEYGSYLTNEKKESFLNISSIKSDMKIEFTSSEHIQGSVIRIIFEDLFDKIVCTKNIKFSDGEHTIEYAKNIRNGLVNHYSNEFASKKEIKIDDISDPVEQNIINTIINKLGPTVLSIAFNCDGLTLINAVNDEEVNKTCDSYAVKEYISKINTVSNVNTKVNQNDNNSKLNTEEKNLLNTIYTSKEELINKPTVENTQSLKVSLITEEEYEKLCMKSINNKQLTKEEILQMQYFDEYYFGKKASTPVNKQAPVQQTNNTSVNEKTMTLKPTKKEGFVSKFLPLFIILFVAVLGVICGSAMFNLFQ